MPRPNFRRLVFVAAGFVALAGFSGCEAKKHAAEARGQATLEERLALEEQAQREAAAANRAITKMTDRAFRRRTPEEEAQHQAETARQVEAILNAQREAEAKAVPTKP